MDENHIITETLDSETFPVEHKRANNKRQYLFSNYRVEIMKDKQGLGDNVAYIALGQKHSGNTFKKVIGQVTDAFKVLATIIKIVDEFADSTYGRTFDGFSIMLPKQSTDRHIRLIKRLLKARLLARYNVLASDYSFDNNKRIWVVRKGMDPASVFNGDLIDPNAFTDVVIDTDEPKPKVPVKTKPVVPVKTVPEKPAPEPPKTNPFVDKDMDTLSKFQNIFGRVLKMGVEEWKSELINVKTMMVGLKSQGVIDYGEKLIARLEGYIKDASKDQILDLKAKALEYLYSAEEGAPKATLEMYVRHISNWLDDYENDGSEIIKSFRYSLIDIRANIRDILDVIDTRVVDTDAELKIILDKFTRTLPGLDIPQLEQILNKLNDEWMGMATTIKSRTRLSDIEDTIIDRIDALKAEAKKNAAFDADAYVKMIDANMAKFGVYDTGRQEQIRTIGVGFGKAYYEITRAETKEQKITAYRDFRFYRNLIAQKDIPITMLDPDITYSEIRQLYDQANASWEYDFNVDAVSEGKKLLNDIGYKHHVRTPAELRKHVADAVRIDVNDMDKLKAFVHKWGKSKDEERYQKAVTDANTPKKHSIAVAQLENFRRNRLTYQEDARSVEQLDAFFNEGTIPSPSVVGITLHNYLKSIMVEVDITTVKEFINDRINSYTPPKDNNLNLNNARMMSAFNKSGMTKDVFVKSVNELNNLVKGKIPPILFHRGDGPDDSRAWADTRKPGYMINVGDSFKTSTCWHEMGHHVELYNPQIKKASDMELLRRYNAAEKPKTKKMKDLFPNNGYRADEIVINDWALSPYESKIYSHFTDAKRYLKPRATELVAMGFQYLDPNDSKVDNLARRHPEYFAFVMGVVKMLQED